MYGMEKIDATGRHIFPGLISGDPEKVKKVNDVWKFSKDSRSANLNWLLIDTQA